MTAPLTPTGVQAWLASLKDEQACGISASYGKCPLARYLASAGAPKPYVGLVSYSTTGGDGPRTRLPDWALSFIEKIDAWGGLDGERPVPTALARSFLAASLKTDPPVQEEGQ